MIPSWSIDVKNNDSTESGGRELTRVYSFRDSHITDVRYDGKELRLWLSDVFASRFGTRRKKDETVRGVLVFPSMGRISVEKTERSQVRVEQGVGNPCGRRKPPKILHIPGQILYKSEYERFFSSLADADIIRLYLDDEEVYNIILVSGCDIYHLRIPCEDAAFEVTLAQPIDRSLKDEAVYLSTYIPTIAAALANPGTPARARILCGAAIVYILSPIDLIPDFIPVIGKLDDIIIVPALISMAIGMIPPYILDECREKVELDRRIPRRRWIFALPVIIFYLIILTVLVLVISDLLRK